MAQMDGIMLLRELQRRWPSLNVILLTAHGTIPDAVKATQSGAFAFLTKPVEKDRLLEEVRRALKTSGFSDATTDDWRAEFATRSPLLEDRLAKAHMVASSDAAVLISGEPGTGKELLARAIHRASSRRAGPFIAIDCGALDPTAGETELANALESARGGSMLLRGVDELPPGLQPHLQQLTGSDVRVVATSDWRSEDGSGEALLLEELLDRLAAVHIELPPLGKRREDVPLLVQQCLDDIAVETSQPKRACSPEAMELLASAKWPGNVRELRMVVRQAAALGAGALITAEQVQEALGQATQLPSFDEARDEFTRNYLVQLLQISEGNVSQAARLAKRNRTDFYKLLTKYAIKPDTFKP
jgi:two-component system response regulator GlrR